MVNIWHQYQCMVTFNMSRSASYYESGMGRGMLFLYVIILSNQVNKKITIIHSQGSPPVQGSAFWTLRPPSLRMAVLTISISR